MSKTLNEIAFSIRNQIEAHIDSDDIRIAPEFIYKKIDDVRSALLNDEFKEKKYLDPTVYMFFNIEIQCRKIVADDEDSGDTEYFIEMPQVEAFLGESAIKYIGLLDKKTPFARRSFSGQLFAAYNHWTHHVPTITRFDEYQGKQIAIIENLPTDGLKYAGVLCVPENPSNFCREDERYPIPSYMIHKLELIVLKQLMSTLQIKPDERNDGRETSPVGNPDGNQTARQ